MCQGEDEKQARLFFQSKRKVPSNHPLLWFSSTFCTIFCQYKIYNLFKSNFQGLSSCRKQKTQSAKPLIQEAETPLNILFFFF